MDKRTAQRLKLATQKLRLLVSPKTRIGIYENLACISVPVLDVVDREVLEKINSYMYGYGTTGEIKTATKAVVLRVASCIPIPMAETLKEPEKILAYNYILLKEYAEKALEERMRRRNERRVLT